MCGIVACRTSSPAAEFLLPALRRLEYRGYDSAGVAVQTVDGRIGRLRTVERIGDLEKAVRDWTGPPLGSVGIGHTRWATHGSGSLVNAHPLTDCVGRLALVHNGIIENAGELRNSLRNAGHQFASGGDSEVVCHLIEEELLVSDDLVEAVQTSLSVLRGSWAVAVLEGVTGRLVVSAHRCPLLIGDSAAGRFATSDAGSVAEWVEGFRALEDGEVVELTDSSVAGGQRDATPLIITTEAVRHPGLDGYTDFMAKEIDEQPSAAARVVDELADDVADGKLWKQQGSGDFDRVQIIGCGTSLNAGHVIGNVVRLLGGVPTRLTVASEAAGEVTEPRTLRMAISQSGETADVLQALRTVPAGGPVLALTNNPYSTLARRADAVVVCSAGAEIGVAATKTFVCQVIAGTALMLSALVSTDRLPSAAATAAVEQMRRLPDRLAAAVAASKCAVPQLAEDLSAACGFLFISRGTGIPYAAEGALKLKELSYRWAEHYPAGELKHGPLALVCDGTPVVAIDNGDPKLAANLAEVQARGGRVIDVGSAPCAITVPTDPHAPWGPLESVVPLQILARTIALTLGSDVDRPRNLAKAVTVE